MKYVLITPARNEASLIRKTLESVCAQSARPERWIIVDNDSSDRTAEIVASYSQRFPWIELVRHPANASRSFAAKALAFSAGCARVRSIDFDVIGNLDADVSFDPEYLNFLIRKFDEDPSLGVAGTPFLEDGYDSARDSFEGPSHVAGGVQLFRRQCFEDIGGYIPLDGGGVDWVAVTTARMKGWKTRSFQEKRFNHHRTLGTAMRGTLAAFFFYGEKDYYLGGAPLWELFRVGYRSLKKPYIFGGAALALGYSWAAVRRIPRGVSPALMRFHRAEQNAKLKSILASVARLKTLRPSYSSAGETTIIALAIQYTAEVARVSAREVLLGAFGLV
jgi:glycosyltransferase involved in cell wall biosynthesis